MRLFTLLTSVTLAAAATLNYNFHIGWTRANPDNAFERPVIGINGKWPIPAIVGTVGDEVVIKVTNDLVNQSTALHFHGLFMNGTVHMDGPTQVTQCAIPPGGEFTYRFTLQQPGTYWYHSHHKGQYPDGLRGPFIIHDPQDPFAGSYDDELILTLSDWYHESVKTLNKGFLTKYNPSGAEPVPQAALINDTQNLQVPLISGKTYLIRIINMGALAAQYVWFEDHEVQIIEVDGQYTKPTPASMLYLSVAQRYSVLLTTKKTAKGNFPIVASMDTDLFDVIPNDLNPNVTAWLIYDSTASLPAPKAVADFDFFDDIDLIPYDEAPRLQNVTRRIILDVMMDNLIDGANYAFFNNITYQPPRVPSLYTALSAGPLATNPRVYGEFTNPFILEKGQVIEIILNNLDTGKHPFHLHGHDFQIVHRSNEEAGPFSDEETPEDALLATPVRRDTVVVWPEGNAVLRFVADNPGVWFFHCHIEWHVTSGLVATFIEAPLELQSTIRIPDDHLEICKTLGVKTAGNAAGNTIDFLDLSGERRAPGPLPEGFTAKGWIALGFTSIVGVVGLATVAWYGLSEPLEHKIAREEVVNERGYAAVRGGGDDNNRGVGPSQGTAGPSRSVEVPLLTGN